MSKNHQMFDLQNGTIFKRYQKTIVGSLAGIRPDPHKLQDRISYLLSTPEHNVSYTLDNDGFAVFDGVKVVDYDEEVLEIYSEQEDRIFRRLNETYINSGILVEYSTIRTVFSTSNDLTDQQVRDLAVIRLPNSFKKAIEPITSAHTLKRILREIETADRPKSFYKIVENKLKDAS